MKNIFILGVYTWINTYVHIVNVETLFLTNINIYIYSNKNYVIAKMMPEITLLT